MGKLFKNLFYLLQAEGLLLLLIVPVYGYAAEEDVMEEIIVTAEKREAAIEDVPLTIQALQGAYLQEQGVRDIKGVLGLIPNASLVGETSHGTRAYQFRGVATGDTTGDPTVATYIDEFAFAIPGVPYGAAVDLFDVNRVEVLKGPQGTVYGSSSMGGIVKVVTNEPDLHRFDLTAAASFGEVHGHGNDFSTDLMVNVPIIEDKLAVRMVLGSKRLSGWAGVPALELRDGNENETRVGRVKILYQPTEKLTLKASYWDLDEDQAFTNRMDGFEPAIINDIATGESPTDFELFTVTASYDFDFATLTGTWGDMERVADLRALGEQIDTFFDVTIIQPSESQTGEVRLVSNREGALNWIVGGFYQKGKTSADQFFLLTGKGGNPDLFIGGDSFLESEEWAAYGEISYDLWDGKVRPLVGLRYSTIDRELFEDQTITIGVEPPIVIATTGAEKGSETHVNPRFNVGYFPNDDGMFFVNIAQGFRPGALQTTANVAALLAVTGVVTPVQQEIDTLWSYEVGTKWALWDDTLNLAVSLYAIDWQDAQFQTGLSGIAGIINLGDVKGNGIELAVSHQTPVPGLSWSFAGAWNKTEIDKINPLVTAGLPHLTNDDQIPNVPVKNAVLSINYTRPTSLGFEFFSEARYEYRDRMQDLATGFESGVQQRLSLSFGMEKDSYRALLFVDNVTDEGEPALWEQGRMIIPRPRVVGVRVMFTPEFGR
jgi:outer membrane receptor protein involved in Fe transport